MHGRGRDHRRGRLADREGREARAAAGLPGLRGRRRGQEFRPPGAHPRTPARRHRSRHHRRGPPRGPRQPLLEGDRGDPRGQPDRDGPRRDRHPLPGRQAGPGAPLRRGVLLPGDQVDVRERVPRPALRRAHRAEDRPLRGEDLEGRRLPRGRPRRRDGHARGPLRDRRRLDREGRARHLHRRSARPADRGLLPDRRRGRAPMRGVQRPPRAPSRGHPGRLDLRRQEAVPGRPTPSHPRRVRPGGAPDRRQRGGAHRGVGRATDRLHPRRPADEVDRPLRSDRRARPPVARRERDEGGVDQPREGRLPRPRLHRGLLARAREPRRSERLRRGRAEEEEGAGRDPPRGRAGRAGDRDEAGHRIFELRGRPLRRRGRVVSDQWLARRRPRRREDDRRLRGPGRVLGDRRREGAPRAGPRGGREGGAPGGRGLRR